MTDSIPLYDLLTYYADGTESAFQRAMRKWRETERETKNNIYKINVPKQLTPVSVQLKESILRNVDEIIQRLNQHKTSPDSSIDNLDLMKYATKLIPFSWEFLFFDGCIVNSFDTS